MPSVQNVLIPDWPTKLSTTTRSLLTANPNLNYILPLYDGMTIYMVPAINGILAAKNKVKVASFNATPVVIQNELAKPGPLAADVGGPNQWYGVALADQALRVLAGQHADPQRERAAASVHARQRRTDRPHQGRVDLVRLGQPDLRVPQAVGPALHVIRS